MVFSMRDSVALIDKTPMFIALTRSSMSSKNFLVVMSPWFNNLPGKKLATVYNLISELEILRAYGKFKGAKINRVYLQITFVRGIASVPVVPRLRRYLVFPTFHISYSFLISQFWYSPTHFFIPRIRSSFLPYITFHFPHFSSIIPPFQKKLGIPAKSIPPPP